MDKKVCTKIKPVLKPIPNLQLKKMYLTKILESVGRLVFAVTVDVPRAPVGVRERPVASLDEEVVVRNHSGAARGRRADIWKIPMKG